jgi:hypothetical protein
MPAAKQRARTSRATTRGRTSSNGSSGSSRAAGGSRQQSAGTKKRAANGTSGASGTASKTASRTANKTASRASSNGQSQDGPSTITSIGMSAAAATIGVAGGVLLGRTALQRNRKVLGIKLPVKVDLGDVTKQLGAAGRQFGKLAGEVRAVREKAEQVGKAIS